MKSKRSLSILNSTPRRNKLTLENEEIQALYKNSDKIEADYNILLSEIDKLNLEIKEQDDLVTEAERKIEDTKMLMAKALEIEKNTTEKYNHAMKEEKEIVDDIVRSETFNFLLRESIHSFSLFKDYFTENENIWYDSHIKIEKFNNISIERIDPEEEKLQGKIKQFWVDTILHDNMFKYFMTSIKFIKQRLLYLFDYVWKEKSLWSNTRENKLKIVMILLNKSYEIFEGIMESIQLKIENQNGSSFDISLFQCGEGTYDNLNYKFTSLNCYLVSV